MPKELERRHDYRELLKKVRLEEIELELQALRDQHQYELLTLTRTEQTQILSKIKYLEKTKKQLSRQTVTV